MIRFTIRDVLWLTVVAALMIAWWIDRSTHLSQARRLEHVNAELSADAKQQTERAEEAWRILSETANARAIAVSPASTAGPD
jgi:hypothetical protein